MKGMLKYCALALVATLSLFEPLVERVRTFSYSVLTACEDARSQVKKLAAELAANFNGRLPEAPRANGLAVESHGFRIAAMVALPFEVGWQGLKTI